MVAALNPMALIHRSYLTFSYIPWFILPTQSWSRSVSSLLYKRPKQTLISLCFLSGLPSSITFSKYPTYLLIPFFSMKAPQSPVRLKLFSRPMNSFYKTCEATYKHCEMENNYFFEKLKTKEKSKWKCTLIDINSMLSSWHDVFQWLFWYLHSSFRDLLILSQLKSYPPEENHLPLW